MSSLSQHKQTKAVIQTERLLVSPSTETFTYATKQSGAETQLQHTEMLFKDTFFPTTKC